MNKLFRGSAAIVLMASVLALNACATSTTLKQQAQVWNRAFAEHDVAALRTVLSDDFQFTSAGGKCATAKTCEEAFRSLLLKRPDLKWINKHESFVVNEVWRVAHENGDWFESWTESDGGVEIRGKYFVIWKEMKGTWQMHAAIFVPMSCHGESKYCSPHS